MAPAVKVVFPPRSLSGAHSNTSTLAPLSLADSAAHNAAFPAPITKTSTGTSFTSTPLNLRLMLARCPSRHPSIIQLSRSLCHTIRNAQVTLERSRSVMSYGQRKLWSPLSRGTSLAVTPNEVTNVASARQLCSTVRLDACRQATIAKLSA